MLVKRAGKLKIGNGLDESVEMGPAVDESQLQTDLKYIEIGKKEGAKLLCGGKRLTGPEHKNGFFIEPTVFADVTPKMRIFKEEIFGPVLSVIPCSDLRAGHRGAERLRTTASRRLGLHSGREQGVRGDARRRHRHLLHQRPDHRSRDHLPFGGVKQTGNGHREGGKEALDLFSEWKAIYVDFSGHLQKAQIDTDALVKME